MNYATYVDGEEITDFIFPDPVTQSAATMRGPVAPEPAAEVSPAPAKTPRMKVSKFDYSDVGPEVAREAEQVAKRIRDRLRASKIDIGKDLLLIKDKLGHGNFGDWLRFHFDWSERSAQNMMNAADAFGSTPEIADKLPEALIYRLAAKSTPPEIREAVTDAIEMGGTPTRKEIEDLLLNYRAKKRCETPAVEDALSNDAQVPSTAAADGERCRETIEDEMPSSTSGAAGNGESARQSDRPREMEARANKIVRILKKELGAHFDNIRTAMLIVDLVALQKALRDF